MPDAPEPFDDLLTHAHETRVVVVGAGIAGLVAAWECARVGMPVTVLEASDDVGGTVASAEVAGLALDIGADCWSRSDAVRELVEELGLTGRVITPADEGTWIAGLPRDAAAPVPADAVLGIPANPWDESARRFIGWSGAWRAYLDRLRPPLTIGKELNLARLVRTRMGDAVLERMVAPLTAGRYGIAPDAVDVSAAAPGLSTALTRTGSLGGAVADLLVGRRGPAVESLDGGMRQLIDALVTRLADLGAVVETGASVDVVVRDDDGWRALDGAEERARGDVLIVAASPHAAARLLAPHAGETVGLMTDAASTREIVTLVVDAPELDAAPRGSQIYRVPGSGPASGLVHGTARWEWLARAAGPGRHVVRVAFDRPPGSAAASATSDTEAVAAAREEASAVLGVRIDADAVRGWHRAEFPLPLPASALGHDERAAGVRSAVTAVPGLAAVGAWLAGSGLAAVVGHARAEAERVRRAALWGSASAG